MRKTLEVLAISTDYGALCQRLIQEGSIQTVRLRSFSSWHNIDWSQLQRQQSTAPLLFISRLADLPAGKAIHPSLQRVRRFLVFTEGMPAESFAARVSRLNIRDESRLHITSVKGAQKIAALIRRMLRGASSSQDQRIIDAWWEGDRFIVLSALFERLVVPLSKLAKLIGQHGDAPFEIDPDGSFVIWPGVDVHLGWTQFLQMIDPAAIVVAQTKQQRFNKRYGEAIRRRRDERGLRQSDIAGLTPRQVGRIETGECRATHRALGKLAAAHGMELSDYLAAVAEGLRPE